MSKGFIVIAKPDRSEKILKFRINHQSKMINKQQSSIPLMHTTYQINNIQ